jgi:hypothetical protein
MLACIPTRPDYDEWLRISSAAWNTWGEDATPYLEAWSPPERGGEYQAKFKGRLRDVNVGTLIHLAKAGGYQPPRRVALVESRGVMGTDPTPSSEAPPPFPTHCIPGVAGDMAREIARVTTAQNEPLAAATVLSVISAAMGAGIEVSTGGGRCVRGNTFTLAIADSGTGKGETYSIAAEPFEQLEAEALASFDMNTRPRLIANMSVATARAAKLCKDAAKESDPDARRGALLEYQNAEAERAEIQKQIDSSPRWRVGDTTREALAAILQGQPGEACASMSSEARGILSIIKGKYTKEGGDEDFYCSAYSGDSITITRKSGGNVSLRRPCLTVLWMIQPDAARKAFGDEALAESGFLARFLTFDPKAEPQERYEQPEPIPDRITDGWRNLIASLATQYRANGGEPAAITPSPAAIDILTDYERENVRRRRKTGDLRDLAPFVARWTENAWRLALVIHCATHGMKSHAVMLDAEAAGAGVELMRWFSEMQLDVLRSGRREKLQKRLLALLAVLAEANGEISVRELRRSHSFDEEEIRQLASLFPSAFRLVERRDTGGRPSLVATTRLEDKEK